MSARISVHARVAAPIRKVWHCWTNPDDIVEWNAASDDWHTTSAKVDLRVGGAFSFRMEAKDGSAGFDFAGEYLQIEEYDLIETKFGDRTAVVQFIEKADEIYITQSFDAEDQNPEEMQRAGWQAILDNFVQYVEAK